MKKKQKKDEPYKIPKCCQEAIARGRKFCPVCHQTFMDI